MILIRPMKVIIDVNNINIRNIRKSIGSTYAQLHQILSWSTTLVDTLPMQTDNVGHRSNFGAESDDDESDESDDDRSGSRFTSGSCFSLRFELFTDRDI